MLVGIFQDRYSWCGGSLKFFIKNHPDELEEIREVLESIHIRAYKTKISEEKGKSKPGTAQEETGFKKFIEDFKGKNIGKKGKKGQQHFAYVFPESIINNKLAKEKLNRKSWGFNKKAKWLPPGKVGIGEKLYSPTTLNKRIGKELKERGWIPEVKIPRTDYNGEWVIDFIKNKVGVEVQFGKYAFVDYDVFGKMPIFHKKGKIDCGVEIVPTKKMQSSMSSGPGDIDRIRSDMKARGVSEIDLPILVIGVGPKEKKE